MLRTSVNTVSAYGFHKLFFVLNMPFMPKQFLIDELQGQECMNLVNS